MSGCAKLGLGTVQWGMTYGIANTTGQPDAADVASMLDLARQHGALLLDTAATYGDAETVLGKLGAAAKGFQVVTKTPPIKAGCIRQQDLADIEAAFATSLQRLGCRQVYGLMVHHSDNLLMADGEHLWGSLRELKANGQVQKIGVSVYDPEPLAKILDRYDIDVVQLPLNLYDQRFVQAGMLQRLKIQGVEIHARSAFLQGLLLMSPEQLPDRFSSLRGHHVETYRRMAEAELSPRAACLAFCLGQAGIDKVVVGVETLQQLAEIIAVAENASNSLPWAAVCAIDDEFIINPSKWPR